MTLLNFASVLKKYLFIISIFCFGFTPLFSQVIDDSTQLVYGPKTTLFTTEENIKNNIEQYQVIDTSLEKTHLWDPVALTDYRYQNLGTVGTALRPVFYQTPDVIGKRSGFSAYDYYIKTPDEIKYFDTKSPFTQMRSVLGGNYRAYIGVDFSRNITENWNAGFSFRRWTVDKQIGPLQSRGDLNVISHSYDISTDYRSPDRKYQVLFNFTRTFHKVNETGGIRDSAEIIVYENLFGYDDEDINLRNAQGGELRQQYHLYQQYKLNKLLQFYYTFDRTNQMNLFLNSGPTDATDVDYFDQFLLRTDSTTDLTRYVYVQNEVGFKGEIGSAFYRFYAKRKDIRFTGKYLQTVNATAENYAGGYFRFAPRENWQFDANAEYELSGNYKLAANLKIPFLTVSALSMQFASPFFYEQHFGNHDYWRNNFGSERVQQLSGKLDIRWKDYIRFQPKLDLKIVSNHMYFDTEATPQQSSGTATLLHPGVEMKARLGAMNLEADYIYTLKEGADADLFRIPEHFLNLDLYYSKVFEDRLEARIGIEAHYKSTYFADDYDPVTQQFYLQNYFEVPGYMFADVYASAKINTARLFVKFRHFNQDLTAGGYFTTPYYTGQERILDLGVTWSFFD
ncbi:putative porin [Marivirga sp.]|uniref:putative porin n=1 Tax=Marivirga sp. TaxID=2018662 RepID=UPI002D800C1C|nr:putative porin [Marivirga sp.]HET8858710.1 putative porin [Marivirga sp.]